MKKLIALLLSLMLLAGCAALAETEATPAAFDVRMDKIPDGYAFEYAYTENSLQGTFVSMADANAAVIYFAIGQLDDDYTFNTDLTDAELAEMTELLKDDYDQPVLTERSTKHGTHVLVVQEMKKNAECDYADFFTAWHGYSIQVGLLKNSFITEEDIDLAMTILSDMWVVNE